MNLHIFICSGSLPATIIPPVKGEVHLWYLASGALPNVLSEEASTAFMHSLSHDECVRRDSFHFSHDARNFAMARGFLRNVLGAYCNDAPHTLQFTYGPCGKPSLTHDSPISFNLSHSGEDIVIGITHKTDDLGVDIELFRDIDDLENLLNAFHSDEKAFIKKQPRPLQPEQFFRLWTCKEAVIKATGEGLSRSLQSFCISMVSPTAITFATHPKRSSAQWELATPELAPNLFCAVALRQST